MSLTLGTAVAKAGEIAYGEFDIVAHPVGGADRMPVVIAQGKTDGPVFWITAGIHGPEHAGIQVLHRLITPDLTRELRGTLVAIPALNPAGLRRMEREAYYHRGDPNRLWPDGKPKKQDPDTDPPSALEQAFGRLFEEIRRHANFFIDLHNASTGSISFVFRDRVMYRKDGDADAERNKAEAEALNVRLDEMCQAYGHSVVGEFPARKYLEEKLHRSSTAAAVNIARIPALTMELGTGHVPDQAIVRAAVAGLRNTLRWAGMLPGEREPITGIKIINPGFPCRRREGARVPQSCVVHHLLEPGDTFKAGDPLVEMRDTWGRPVGEGILRADVDGWVIGHPHGIFFYPTEAAEWIAVRDEESNVEPFPEEYFK